MHRGGHHGEVCTGHWVRQGEAAGQVTLNPEETKDVMGQLRCQKGRGAGAQS